MGVTTLLVTFGIPPATCYRIFIHLYFHTGHYGEVWLICLCVFCQDSMFPRNSDIYLKVHMASQPRRTTSTSSPQWEPQISHVFISFPGNLRPDDTFTAVQKYYGNQRFITAITKAFNESYTEPCKFNVIFKKANFFQGNELLAP
jgi:hypothetical protein